MRWRRWMAGSNHGVARGVAVYGVLMALTLTTWMSCWTGLSSCAAGPGARLRLSGVPGDLELLNWVIDEWDHDGQIAALGAQLGSLPEVASRSGSSEQPAADRDAMPPRSPVRCKCIG